MQINLSTKPCSTIINKTGGWRTYIPKTDLNKCIACGTCVRVCPENCVVMKVIKEKKQPFINFDYCKGCGICASECPVQCIKMELDVK